MSFFSRVSFKFGAVWIFLIFLALTISFRIVFFQTTKQAAKQNQSDLIKYESEKFKSLILNRMDHYILSLYSVRALFSLNSDVNRVQWSDYGKNMDVFRRFPGLSSLTYLKRVATKDVPKHIETIRSDTSLSTVGYPNVRFYPEPLKDEDVLIITYLYPSTVNTNYLGFNYLSKPERYQSVMQAVETNTEVATPMLEAPLSKTSLFAILLPIYDESLPNRTVEERKLAWTGVVSTGFSVNTLFSELVSEASFTRPTVVDVFEGEQIDDTSKIYTYSTLPKGTEIEKDDEVYSQTQTLTVGKQVWTMRFRTIISNDIMTIGMPIYQLLILASLFTLTLVSAVFIRPPTRGFFLPFGPKRTPPLS